MKWPAIVAITVAVIVLTAGIVLISISFSPAHYGSSPSLKASAKNPFPYYYQLWNQGRTGNILMQYYNMRILAETSGKSWHWIAPIPSIPYIQRRGEARAKNNKLQPAPNWEGIPERFHSFQKLSFCLMTQYRKELLTWVEFPKPKEEYDWTLHLRFGDIWKSPVIGAEYRHYIAPYDFYYKALPKDEPKGTSVVIVSEMGAKDDTMREVLARFRKDFPNYVFTHQRKTVLEDLCTLIHSKNLVGSFSTYALVAAFLGSGKAIVPYTPNGYISEKMVLGLDDREGVTLVNVKGMYRFWKHSAYKKGFFGMQVELEPRVKQRQKTRTSV